jgi:DNA-binding transcriptional LysR family regulator
MTPGMRVANTRWMRYRDVGSGRHGSGAMLERAVRYFDEVSRRGSIRKAAERLHIAPSAVDRQILQLEARIGAPLFERLPQGLRMTAAGELLLGAVRRWKGEYERLQSQIRDLQGLCSGEVSVALVEGATEFMTVALRQFRARYPGIAYRLHTAGHQAVTDAILSGAYEVGVTFNPPALHALRIECKVIYRIGVVVTADHPLAEHGEVTFEECLEWGFVVPDETISIRPVLESLWRMTMDQPLRESAATNSIALLKSMVKGGVGVGILTGLDVLTEVRTGELRFIPLAYPDVPVSELAVVVQASRELSGAAATFVQHLSVALGEADAALGAGPARVHGEPAESRRS